jgi:hypothetical protein
MKRLALAAAGAAVMTLTACGGHSAAPSGAAADGSANNGGATAPVSCKQQYHQWSSHQGKGVMGALQGVSSAAKAGNAHVLTAALTHARPAVAKGAKHPIPACADPRGYWPVLLMHVNAAASSKSSASSAKAALQGVPKVMNELSAYVKQTAH